MAIDPESMTDVGRVWLLQAVRAYYAGGAGGSFHLRLFKGDVTPDIETEAGDLTEADFSGYLAKTLTFPAVDAEVDDDHKAWWRFPEETFLHSGGGVSNGVYGWYLTSHEEGILVHARRFDNAPISMAVTGDPVSVRPEIYLGPIEI